MITEFNKYNSRVTYINLSDVIERYIDYDRDSINSEAILKRLIELFKNNYCSFVSRNKFKAMPVKGYVVDIKTIIEDFDDGVDVIFTVNGEQYSVAYEYDINIYDNYHLKDDIENDNEVEWWSSKNEY